MSRTVLGKVGMTPKGNYSSTTEYVRLDVVTKAGQSYVCIKDCSGTDVTNTTYWQLIAEKGEMPVNGVDYNTEQDKQTFKEAVVADSKAEMDNYTTEKKDELDTYTVDKKSELDTYKTDLEGEMSTTKDNLVKDINTTATENIEEFNNNAETKTNAFNDNATTQTNNFNSNVESKTTDFNNNVETKLNEYNSNSTAKLEEYNTNATNKVAEFNDNVDSLENELTELAGQMPWNKTDIESSIHVEDSAKYSRNKLGLFGNLKQEVSEIGNNKFDGIMESGNINYEAGVNETSNSRIRSKNYIDIEGATKITIVAEQEYETATSVGLRLYDKDYNYIGRNAVSDFIKSVSFNVSTALIDKTTVAKYCRFNVVDTDDTKKFSVNINETIEYEEYIPNKPSVEHPSIPVVATGVQKITRCEKNLLNIPDSSASRFGLDIVVKDNKIILNGTVETGGTIIISSDLNLKLNGEVTFSQQKISGTFETGAYRFYLLNEEITSFLDSPLSFTSSAEYSTNTVNTKLTRLGVYVNNGNVFNNYTIDLQVERGKNVTEHETYNEETFSLDLGTTELCKIVDENSNIVAQDRAVYKDSKWQWEKNVKKAIIDGTNIKLTVFNNNLEDVLGFRTQDVYGLKSKSEFCNCDKYKTSTASYLWKSNVEGIAYSMTGNYFAIYINKSRFDGYMLDMTDEQINNLVNNYLQNNNITFYYSHITTEYIDCTQAQSEVLDKLYKLSLQQGTNNIYVESGNGVTTELQLTYMQDLMSQINELKQAMLNIGGN